MHVRFMNNHDFIVVRNMRLGKTDMHTVLCQHFIFSSRGKRICVIKMLMTHRSLFME
jgi:hypothetical protein